MVTSHDDPFGYLDRDGSCKAAILAGHFLRSLNSPLARAVKKALAHNDYETLLNCSVDPSDYSCVDAFWRDYAAVSLLSKFPEFDNGVDLEAVALAGFSANEETCRITNERIRAFARGLILPGVCDQLSADRYNLNSVISTAADKIQQVLGVFSWDRIEPYMNFSGGSSTRLSRAEGDAIYKMGDKPHVTPDALLLAQIAVRRCPFWAEQMRAAHGPLERDWFQLVIGNEVLTVPKNAKTNRTIAREPCMNMFMQKGIGSLIRKLLKRFGVDLDTQVWNQDLARVAQALGLATIDLKAASDCVTVELCRLLLPPDWFEAMMLLRSRYGTMPDGSLVEYEKMSSMGNGFTFELETLLFWALGEATLTLGGIAKGIHSVYGDDIIIDTRAAGYLIETLDFVGFKTNLDKTFCSGPFRESCGKHYFNGVDVTPMYIRRPIVSRMDAFLFCNNLRRWASRPTPGYADPRFHTAWSKSVRLLPVRDQVCSIPDGFGDGGLIGTFSEVLPARAGKMQQWKVHYTSRRSGRIKGDGARFYLRQLLKWDPDGATWLQVECDESVLSYDTTYVSQWVDAPLWCVT